MKYFISLLMLMQTLYIKGQPDNNGIIPLPAEAAYFDDFYTITESTSVMYNHPDAKDVADRLSQRLSISTGYAISAKPGDKGAILLMLNKTENMKTGREGYVLQSSARGVEISANTPAGLFYGMQTLLQLLPKEIERKQVEQAAWKIPAAKITDYPRFGWRGLMLDVSRHFFTVDEVKRFIDVMARYKYNTLHWHLSDDHGWRVEIKALPRLTETGAWRVPRAGHFGTRPDPEPGEPATYGGFYTHEEIRDVVRYAAEQHITIIPEIDVPGHSMAALAAYPELSVTKDPNIRVNPGTEFAEWYGDGTFKMLVDNTLNPADENVYLFLDKVFTEIAQLFPNPYIHIGGDECYKGYWEKDPSCQALMQSLGTKHVEALHGYFVNRVEKILASKGKKLLGWDEILDGNISPEATIMSWRGVSAGIKATQAGHDVVMTPTTYAYLDYTQGDPSIDPPIYSHLRLQKCYSFNPVPEGAVEKHILGGQGNLWTEQIATLKHAEYMLWPRAWALIEDYWTPEDKKNWISFVQRVEHHFERCDIAQINYSRSMYDPIIRTRMKKGKMQVEITSEVPGLDIFYTIDDAMPGRYSPRYTGIVELPEGDITLRVVTYKNNERIGHLITLSREDLKNRLE